MRISDWSSDVCSSDLDGLAQSGLPDAGGARWLLGQRAGPDALVVARARGRGQHQRDRKSVVEGKSVSVRGDLGGRRIIKKKKKIQHKNTYQLHQHVHNINTIIQVRITAYYYSH